jgi:hypothetical protein
VRSGRLLLGEELPDLPRVRAIVADRGYRALDKLVARRSLTLEIKDPPKPVPPPVVPGRSRRSPRASSRRSPRCSVSSTRSPGSGPGGACRAATRERRRAPRPGSKSPASATSSVVCAGRRPDRISR